MIDAARCFVVGIAGETCAGKSTLARALQAELGGPEACVVLHQDDYFSDYSEYPEPERAAITTHNHPAGVRWELLRADIDALRSGRAIELPAPRTRSAATGERRTVVPARVLLVEGHLILADDETRTRCDLKLYLEVDANERVLRRIGRTSSRGGDIEAAIAWYRRDVIPNAAFAADARNHADLIVPYARDNARAREMLAAGIAQLAAGA